MTRTITLLDSLVETIVREWGRSKVQESLDRIANSNPEVDLAASGTGKRIKRVLLTAHQQVEKSSFSDDRKALLDQLAQKFDEKQFLPSIADVREFLIMNSHRPGEMKNRSDAFRILLRVLSSLPSDRLNQLAQSSRYSGPAQLGPLSDAISNVGSENRRLRESESSK